MTTIRVGQRRRFQGRTRKASQVVKNKRAITKIRRMQNADEFKNTLLTVNDAQVSATGTVQAQIFVVAVGDDFNERDGRKITLTKVQATFELILEGGTNFTQTSDIFRMMLVIDKQANGALPAVSDILQSAVIESYVNLNNKKRFTVLIDRLTTLNSMCGSGVTGTEYGRVKKIYRITRKLNLPILYSGDDGLIDKIKSNNVLLLFISSNALVGCNFHVRFFYLD